MPGMDRPEIAILQDPAGESERLGVRAPSA